jgi:hypothetical protein
MSSEIKFPLLGDNVHIRRNHIVRVSVCVRACVCVCQKGTIRGYLQKLGLQMGTVYSEAVVHNCRMRVSTVY